MTPPAATVAGRNETKCRKTEEEQPESKPRPRAQGPRPQDPRGAKGAGRARRVSGPDADAAFAAETRGLTAAARTASRPATKAGARAGTKPGAKAGTKPRTKAPTAAPRVPRAAATVAPRIEIDQPSRRHTRRQVEPEPRRPLHHRAVRSVVHLPDHRLLDRVVRGRAWIPVLGVLLVAIVGMRVEVLKLGASVGRSVSEASTLQSRNELLRESVSALSGDERIEALAQKYGMVMPNTSNVQFIDASSGNAKQAAGSITAPDPAEYRAQVEEEDVANPDTDVTAGMPASAVGDLSTGEVTAAADTASSATVGGTSTTSTTSTTSATDTTPTTSDTATTGATSTTPATADGTGAAAYSVGQTATTSTTPATDAVSTDPTATAPTSTAPTETVAPTTTSSDTATTDTGETSTGEGAVSPTDTAAVTPEDTSTTGASGLAG